MNHFASPTQEEIAKNSSCIIRRDKRILWKTIAEMGHSMSPGKFGTKFRYGPTLDQRVPSLLTAPVVDA
jgi:hypothetical protein